MQVSTSAAVPDGAAAISIDDERYPPLLREIHDPPELIYIRGDPAALLMPQLAIVGSRRASAAGLRLAQEMAGELVKAGLSVCSGLALGIDGAAHRGALASGGTSVAVMATGIDEVYPRRHRALGEELARDGCLVTEFPPGAPPLPGNFPRRNRIISGMSLGVLVVEAALPSGSLLTAQSALEQGREVFALPWSVPHAGGRGCLKLLQDGARMALSVDDILAELGALHGRQLELLGVEEQPQVLAPDVQRTPANDLLQYIGYEEVSLDGLQQCSGRAVAQLLALLSELEVAGRIVRTAGGYMRV